MPAVEQEEKVIRHWVALRRAEGFEVESPQWLDRGPDGDIDALAQPFAIEHTSVDALPRQRQVRAQFAELSEGFGEVPFDSGRLRLTIDYTDFTSVDHGELLVNLKRWLQRDAPHLPEGASKGQRLGAFPVRWWAFHFSDRPAGAALGLGVDSDSTSSTHIKTLLGRKANKLRSYKRESPVTVLIVESEDLALMDAGTFLRICAAESLKLEPVDELWFADTSLGDVELWQVDLNAIDLRGPFYPELTDAV